MMSEGMARWAAHWWRNRLDGGVDAIRGDRFEKELAELLLEEGKTWDYFSIGSEYGPEGMLYWAAWAAWIERREFPFKTWMHLDAGDGMILVTEGCGNPRVVWTEEKGQEGQECTGD